MKQVTIYTDGACSGNPGPGGWGAVLLFGEFRRELSGYEGATTNNRMEMTAAIEALGALKEPCEVSLYTDSAYLAHAFQKHWLDNWQRNNWLKSDKKPVENRDLWEKLLALAKAHKLTFFKVKGHANNKENNRCDELATGAVQAGRNR
ncbi:MAG: ribonuclease HI [Clostridia bacterium]